MSNSIIDNQVDLQFILECFPPTEDEILQAKRDIFEFNIWYVLGSTTKKYKEELVTQENINRRVLNTRKRLNKILTFKY